ncbi:hypothetical protein AUC43_03955 [Hymenobacter sedentarius]|uniref:DUF4369 domain-containing protein n=1 Tax=Hymenobacter sedentarius TaxID=1411621 RepID=A0A0U4BVM7_9BACT|nr:hypothetical protein [Hymenobacter sedentarius]ALW84321.1 hypothetical protein AUC43_03955 [Hymenobacter sedentarius]
MSAPSIRSRPFWRNTFLLAVLLASRAGQAQHTVPGYVVTAGQDSLRGAIVLHDNLTQQARVDFIPLRGVQRLSLMAAEVKAYGYIRKQDTVRYVAIALNYGPRSGAARRVFIRQLVAGPVELYKYYFNGPTNGAVARPGGGGTPLERPTAATAAHPQLYASQAGSGQPVTAASFPPLSVSGARLGAGHSLLLHRRAPASLVEITAWNFPVDAAAYFADYPALAADLRTKRYKARDVGQVLKRYNAWRAAGPARH